MSLSTTISPDLPAASGLTGQTTELPTPGEFPALDVETQVPIIIGVSSVFLVLSTLLVAARMYTRYGLIKAAGNDDITIGIAQVQIARPSPRLRPLSGANTVSQFFNIGLVITIILRTHTSRSHHSRLFCLE